MTQKVRDQRGASVLVWILVVAVAVMLVLVLIPVIGDIGKNSAVKQDEAHEQTCLDSVFMEWAGNGSFDAVYDYYGKRFVGLNDHPYQVQAYGNTKEHEDCVILVHCDSSGEQTLTWISRKTLRERYR